MYGTFVKFVYSPPIFFLNLEGKMFPMTDRTLLLCVIRYQ